MPATPKKAASWGKPSIFVKDLNAETPAWQKIPTPVEDSTQLTPTKGDALEGKIEGGEVEVSKQKKSSYELAYALRLLAQRAMPIQHVDGDVEHEYAVALVPEDASAPGFYIERTSVSVEDPFTAGDGSNWTYTHKALAPSSGKIVKWGTITATAGTGSTYTLQGQGMDFGSTAVEL